MSNLEPPIRTLMGPGPSDIHPRVLEAIGKNTIGHLDPYYLQVMDRMQQMLRSVFCTQNEMTFAISATGSAGMEATVVNLIEPGDSMVVCVNGVFGSRMADVAERARCEEALGDLDGAAVETIHAFCRRLLATHPLQAGLPPAFDLLDGTEADALFGDQWDEWFAELLNRANTDADIGLPLLRVLALGATPNKLRDLAWALRGHWDRLTFPTDPISQPSCDMTKLVEELGGSCKTEPVGLAPRSIRRQQVSEHRRFS
ncbi:MAG: UvrD-helicase domain-containing protein [Planctomycetes bacterium]|nr:UvrD-helicase domain-containing protein [Planctomycetota bacterium]